MDPIEITVRIDPSGKVYPSRFSWRGKDYTVLSTGRQWTTDEGRHVLVMAAGNQVYELLFNTMQGIWYLIVPPVSASPV